MTPDWRAVFEATYASDASPTQERVWRDVLGGEYPDGVDPYSLVSKSELDRFAREVHVGPGATLLDVGCGRGGAGLWVAAATGAHLVGVDIAEAALVDARRRAAAMGASARFVRGEFEATGLEDASVDAIMSIDAMLFTPEKAAAFRELRRVARPGSRLVMTSWTTTASPSAARRRYRTTDRLRRPRASRSSHTTRLMRGGIVACEQVTGCSRRRMSSPPSRASRSRRCAPASTR
jgi:SAM-dependent methyltransferase